MPLREDELMHYGVLGMHWGIRRYQPYPKTGPDGKFIGKLPKYRRNADKTIRSPHRIPKGTKMYRMTTVSNETPKGSTYVTFRKQDRNFYRIYSRQQHKDQKTYEQEMEAKEDINIPSVKEQNDVIRDILKDPKQIAKAKKAVEEFGIRSRVGDANLNDAKSAANAISKAFKKAKIDPDRDSFQWRVTDKNFEVMHESGKVTSVPMKGKDVMAKARIASSGLAYIRGKNLADHMMSTQASHDIGYMGLMYNKQLKEKMIKKLSDRGYNAMVDQAGIGVIKNDQGKVGREGYETLIVFDREKTLSNKKIQEVTDEVANKGYSQYERDFKYGNRYRK